MTTELLFIEGFSLVSGWMSEKLRGLDSPQTRRTWSFASITQAQCFSIEEKRTLRPNMNAIRKCRDQIASGKFHAIIVVDLSADQDFFAKELGPSLSTFARNGGAIAFPTSEGLLTCTYLNSIFGTTWSKSAYYRTNWAVADENRALVRHVFGTDVWQFSAKACSLRDVPPHERCWGVTSESETQSMVPTMAGIDVSKAKLGEEWSDSEYDVSVAMHQHGTGWMLYSGDVNLEQDTITLLSNFVKSRAPAGPVNALGSFEELSKLSREEFEVAKNEKNTGNRHFASKNYAEAIKKYDAALAVYGSRTGTDEQMKEKVKIISNKSECLLLQEKWYEAQTIAGNALFLIPNHDKSLLRRAKASVNLAKEYDDPDDRMDELERAEADMTKLHDNSRPSTVSKAVLNEIRQMKGASSGNSDSGDEENDNPSYFATGSLNRMFEQGNGLDFNIQRFTNSSFSEPGKSAWATGLDTKKRYEWLTDCYRMRVDDDYAWGGGDTHGLYNQDGTIAKDFLVFCRLAQENGVIPDRWDWTAFLREARTLLPYAFEKSDAQEKYGGENVFQASMGGRSLRYTGTIVYGCGVEEMDQEPQRVSDVRDEVMGSSRANGRVCRGVGGPAIWAHLCSGLNERWDN